jgi:hypothetical protein
VDVAVEEGSAGGPTPRRATDGFLHQLIGVCEPEDRLQLASYAMEGG